MSELRIKKQTVKYSDFKINFIKIQNKKDIERKISRSLEDVSFLITSLLFEMPTKNTLQKLAKRMEPLFLPDDKKYKIELVVSDDSSKGLPAYWTNLGFEAYVKDIENRNRFEFLDYIIMKEKVSEVENWIKL
jgi:hypothetical protein